MSGSTMVDRRPICYLTQPSVQPSTSGFEYECTDCGRTFRRHATYRRHRQLSHDDDVTAPPSYRFQSSDRLPSVTSCVASDDVMLDMETVENCCVDNEIHLSENSSNGVSDKSEVFLREDLDRTLNGTVSVKIEMEDDEAYEEDEELADFRSAPTEMATTVNSMQKPEGFNDRPRLKVSGPIIFSKMEFDSGRFLPHQQVTTKAEQHQWKTVETRHLQFAASTSKPEMDFKRQTKDEKPEVSQAQLSVSSGNANSTPKIFVYVKTEPQASSFSGGSPSGISAVKVTSDEQLAQPMLSATSVKPPGCQFLCPICQRLFNSEKYLSMHMSSIHRGPDNVVQPQHHQSNGKHVPAVEVVSAPAWHSSTSSSIVAAVAVATPRRLPTSSGIITKVTPSGTTLNPASATPVTITTSRLTASLATPMTSSLSTVLPSLIAVQSSGSAGSKAPQSSNNQGTVASGSAQSGPGRSAAQWTCNICNKSFAQNSSYKNHIRTHSDDRPYVCSICSIGFKERYHLKKHALFKHTTELNETCRVCGKRFKDSTAVRAHERIHSDLRPYGCNLCGKTFKTSECLWHHENRSKTCGKMAVAAAAAMSSGTMVDVTRKHVVQQHDIQTLPAAGQRRQRRSPLSGTIAITKQLPALSKPPSSSFNVIHSAITSISGKLIHNASSPATKPSFAAESSIVFSNSSLIRGLQLIPANDATSARMVDSPSPKLSSTIAFATSSSPLINGHRNSVDDELMPDDDCIDSGLLDDVGLCSIFNGDVDDEVDSAALVDDFWKHFDVDQMTSDYCDTYSADPDMVDSASSSTETASSSDDSEVSGLTIEDFTKDIIIEPINFAPTPSSSPSSSSTSDATPSCVTSKSVAIGAGSKRHDCSRCDKRFASATTLEKHLLVHAEVRPYRCSVCDIGFKLKVHLKKHNLYRHSDDYPCECSVCGKRFKDSSAVRLHERIHSTDRPFQCLHCGKSFKTKENLWGHRNRGPCDKPYSPLPIDTSPLSNGVGSETGSSSESNDVTQHFVANNIRLFHSAEFGPILGVPVNARLVLRDAPDADDGSDEALLRKSDSNGGQSVVLTSSCSSMTSTGLPRLSVAQDASGSQRVFVSMSTTPVFLQSAVPTAVVAPIKRQSDVTSLIDTAVTTPSSVRPSSLVLPSAVRLVPSDDQSSAITGRRKQLLAPSTLPHQLSSAARKRSNSASLVDRCPTVQKYLAFGAGVPTPSSVQKTLNLTVPTSSSSSSSSTSPNNTVPIGASPTSTLLSLAESLNDVATCVLLNDEDANGCQDNDASSSGADDMTLVNWKTLNSSQSASDGLLDDNWNEVISRQRGRRGSVKSSDRRFIANHLPPPDGGEDEGHESSDYNELINIIGSTSDDRNGVGRVERLLGDDDDDRKLLDPFCETSSNNDENSYLTSSGGAGDMMWCGGESAWTPDSDLGGLLVFGPN